MRAALASGRAGAGLSGPGALLLRPLGGMAAVLLGQRGHLFPWVPVAFAVGIGLYFQLQHEPSPHALAGLGLAALAGAFAAWRVERSERLLALAPVVWALVLIAAGLAWAGARSHWVAAPVLAGRYYGPVEGRIVAMDRSASDAVRLVLDRVVIDRAPARTPQRLRLALHGQDGGPALRPGATVLATAHLAPPGGPVEPGGFDFRRNAWFDRLGAVGYTRVPVVTLTRPEPGALRIFRFRMALSQGIRDALPGERGAFAAAVTTGDRSAIAGSTLEALRQTNLAHLLAISGLHMGLLAGVVFGGMRVVLALIPWVALRWPTRAIAAVTALAAATGYLAMSGGNVATERAFVMVAVALLALVWDRRALSLRAVAVAALLVLGARPEALLGPGFQMSFAATVALVAVFAQLRDSAWRWPRALRPLLTLLISSSVAGAATGPVGAAHFNQLAHYGLIANLLSVPVMGLVVAPAAVVAGLLAPLGLAFAPLWVMGQGLGWILWVADTVQHWPGATSGVPAPPATVLPLMALGGLMLAVWQGRGRLAGLVPILVAGWLWQGAVRPAVLIEGEGRLVGLMTAEGRALSRPRGAGFVAEVWLENDGAPAPQPVAAARWPAQARLPDGRLLRHVTGARAVEALDCTAAEVVVTNAPAPAGLPCLVLDPGALAGGALAITDTGWDSAAVRSGQRPWSGGCSVTNELAGIYTQTFSKRFFGNGALKTPFNGR